MSQPPIPASDPRAPKFWTAETSGVLAPVILSYLEGHPLSLAQIGTLRAYFRQWIQSPVWDLNPYGVGALAQLRASCELIRTRADVDAWLALAGDSGIDPL